jgi:hypothetical protein
VLSNLGQTQEPQKAAANFKRQPQMNANDADGIGAPIYFRVGVTKELWELHLAWNPPTAAKHLRLFAFICGQ